MEIKNEIKVKNDQGEEITYDVLSSFDYKQRQFVLFTDYSKDHLGSIKIYSCLFNNEEMTYPIKNREDRLIVSEFIKYLEYGIKTNSLYN